MGRFALVATSSEPVTVSQLRDHLRITTTEQDTHLALILTAATQAAEAHTKRALVRKQAKWYANDFPAGDIVFDDYNPVRAVSSISYKNTTGTATTLSTADYNLDFHGETLRIYPAYSTSWPSVYDYSDARDNVTITFTAGYGSTEGNQDSSGTVPERINAAIKIIAADLYENRESVVVGTVVNRVNIPASAEKLLDQEAVLRF